MNDTLLALFVIAFIAGIAAILIKTVLWLDRKRLMSRYEKLKIGSIYAWKYDVRNPFKNNLRNAIYILDKTISNAGVPYVKYGNEYGIPRGSMPLAELLDNYVLYKENKK